MTMPMDVAIRAAMQAGEFLAAHFRGVHEVTYRDTHNVVSEVDVPSQDIILGILGEAFPHHAFYSEESNIRLGNVTSDYLWVVDPLDGTTNYARGLPYFCTSIALLYQEIPQLGVVYQPMQGELFTAEKGKGAYLNGDHIHTGTTTYIERAVVVMNRGANRIEKLRYGEIFRVLTQHVRSIRIPGATAVDLCYVASGKLDAVINNGCQSYDCAAGNIVAVEAGAIVTDFQNNPLRGLKVSDLLVANTAILHDQLIAILESI